MADFLQWWPFLLAGLAAITAGWLWFRQLRLAAVVCTGCAIGLVTAGYLLRQAPRSVEVAAKAMAVPANTAETERLKSANAKLDAEVRALLVTKETTDRDLVRTRGELGERDRLLERVATELRQVDPARAVLATETGDGLVAERINREVVHLASAFRNLSADKSTRADDVAGVIQLRDRIGAKLDAPSYTISTFPDNEVVRGRTGRYYVVDLKNAERGIRYYFEKGRYSLEHRSEEFRVSLNDFLADIVSRLHGKVDYDLFVRGSADGLPIARPTEPSTAFSRVTFLKSLGGDKYDTVAAEHTIGRELRNEDLPHLRAAYLQKIIADNYPVRSPIVLEGAVTRQVADRDRNAEILLFVRW